MLCHLQSLSGHFIYFLIPHSSEQLDWWKTARLCEMLTLLRGN